MVTVTQGSSSDYKIGPELVGQNDTQSRRRFSQVTHTCHMRTALTIFADRQIKADLVYDSSRLNTERIRVVWMSPNSWYHGSRYGNVALAFDWNSLVEAKRFYWVEVAEYNTPACRIIITDQNRDGNDKLTP